MQTIRIPTKYSGQLSRLPDDERLWIYDSIMRLSLGMNVERKDSMAGDILPLIFAECLNMEKKNKKTEEIVVGVYIAASPAKNQRVATHTIKKDSIPKDNIVKQSIANPPKTISECDQNFSELFFKFKGEDFLFTQKKTIENIPEIINSWSDVFRKMREIDKMEIKQIQFLLEWLFNETPTDNAKFWKEQIRSPEKLRKKNNNGEQYWRVLVMKIKEEREKKTKKSMRAIPTY